MLPPDVKARADELRRSGCLQAWSHVEYAGNNQQIIQIRCKCCGSAIIGLRPIGDPATRPAGDGRTIISEQRVSCGPLPSYRELIVDMDNGGRHVTHCCADCAQSPINGETLEAMYLADLEEMAESSRRVGHDASAILIYLSQFRPIGYRPARLGEFA